MNIEPVERVDHPVGKHEQRGFVEVRNQEQQKVLMPKLSQQSCVTIDEEGIFRVAEW